MPDTQNTTTTHTLPGIPEAAVVPAQHSTTTVTRKRTTRKRPTLANVMMLADWLATHASGVRRCRLHPYLRQQREELRLDVRPRHPHASGRPRLREAA